MAYTYSKIASYTAGSGGASSVVFLAIPQNYTDLKLMVSARNNAAEVRGVPYIYFNEDTTSTNYVYRRLYGIPSVATSSDSGNPGILGYISGGNSTANTFGNGEVYIPNYSSYGKKGFMADGVGETNAADGGLSIVANYWVGDVPIYKIVISPAAATAFAQYSTFTLYGVKAEV